MNLSLEEIIKNSIPSVREVFSGVYFLIFENEIQYIGSGMDVLARIQMHKKLKKFRFKKMFILRCDEEVRLSLEAYYIKKFKPEQNMIHNPNFKKVNNKFLKQ
ncbi:MAG: hypothetical protein RSE50_00750 [Myroides sp.]